MNYTVTVQVVQTYSVQIDAIDDADAEQKALNMEFSEMTELPGSLEVTAFPTVDLIESSTRIQSVSSSN